MRDRWFKFVAILVAAGWLGTAIPAALGQVTVQEARKIPITQDENDPAASREERIRRSRENISRALQQRQQQQAEANKRAAAAAASRASVKPPPGIAGRPESPGEPPQPPGAKHAEKIPDVAKAAQKHVSMYMTPAAQSVEVGKTFSTQWQLINMDGLPFTEIVLAMSYPPDVVKPVSVHQDALEPLIEGEPEFTVDEAAGRLIYRARLAKPFVSSELTPLTILWQALKPANQAAIDTTVGDVATTVLNAGAPQTRTMPGLPDAVIGATVQVIPGASAVPGGYRVLTPDLHDLAPILAGFPDQSKLRPPTLWINQPDSGTLAAGQWMVVDVGIDNPDRMVFDEIRLALKFDPNAVEVLDTDDNNSIHRGVNILDGPFRNNWHWTQQFDNTVSNMDGTIFYHVGVENMSEQPSGPVARIFVRVKQPAAAPVLAWIWEPGNGRKMTSGAYLLGENIYLRGQDRELAQTNLRTIHFNNTDEKADPSQYRDGPRSARTTP